MNQDSEELSDSRIFVLGPMTLQNEFLSYVINKEIGSHCTMLVTEGNASSMQQSLYCDGDGESTLLLIDTENQSYEEVLKNISRNGDTPPWLIALFNLDEKACIEKKALAQNIRGFFYKDDHFNVFLKGIRSIFRGEVWVSRKMLLKYVFDGFNEIKHPDTSPQALTSREIEILLLVRQGSTNDEIANKICISTNTVKTHLYKIFKKINAENRIQAALWATSNL